MTSDPTIFANFLKKKGGHVTFRNNSKDKIIGIGNIGGNPSSLIENIFQVDKLKYNLLSISQLCDKGNKIDFDSDKFFIIDCSSNSVIFTKNRIVNVYIIDIVSPANGNDCLT